MKTNIKIRGSLYDLCLPRVMGILNITPDSFYSGSRVNSDGELLKKASGMIESGADMLDVGAYSSRPGAEDITEKEELERLIPALALLRKEFPSLIISLDTFRSSIAETGIKHFGVDIINDISGGLMDERMYDIIEKYNVPYIIMHMKGNPQTMHVNPVYNDVLAEVIKWFSERKQELVHRGISDIVIDPGFGFGKTIDHNFILLNKLDRFSVLELPLMVGLSRKSMIWKTLGISPDESLNGTVILNTVALMKGAGILRVHDAGEAVQAVKLLGRLKTD